MKQRLLRYWEAANVSAFDSAVRSCVGYSGLAVGHALTPAIVALDLKQFGILFLLAFGHGLWAYLKDHPLSGIIEITDNLEKLNRELGTKVTQATQGTQGGPPVAQMKVAPGSAVPGHE